MTSPSAKPSSSTKPAAPPLVPTVGLLVHVQSRTWSGINKPGGVGHIVKLHSNGDDDPIDRVDVKYVLGGEEKNVELCYVSKHEELDRSSRSRRRHGGGARVAPDTSAGSTKKAAADATPKGKEGKMKKKKQPKKAAKSGDDGKTSKQAVPEWVHHFKKGTRVSYYWNDQSGWCQGSVVREPQRRVTTTTVGWNIRVAFDDGCTDTLAFHIDEKRWQIGEARQDAPPPSPLAKKLGGGQVDTTPASTAPSRCTKEGKKRKNTGSETTVGILDFDDTTTTKKKKSKSKKDAATASTGSGSSNRKTPVVTPSCAGGMTIDDKSSSSLPHHQDEGVDGTSHTKVIKTDLQEEIEAPAMPPSVRAGDDGGGTDSRRAIRNKNEPKLAGLAAATKEIMKMRAKPPKGYDTGSKKRTPLQEVYENESKAAATFVGGIVGKKKSSGATPRSLVTQKESLPEETLKNNGKRTSEGDFDEDIDGTDTCDALEVQVNPGRQATFVSLLNEIMMKRMVDEMEVSNILNKVNSIVQSSTEGQTVSSEASAKLFNIASNDSDKPFTPLEVRSYLNDLDSDGRIMVSWDSESDGMVYRI